MTNARKNHNTSKAGLSLSVPVEEQCERTDCDNDPDVAYIVTAQLGKDGIAVYCGDCSQEFAEDSDNHTALTGYDL